MDESFILIWMEPDFQDEPIEPNELTNLTERLFRIMKLVLIIMQFETQ